MEVGCAMSNGHIKPNGPRQVVEIARNMRSTLGKSEILQMVVDDFVLEGSQFDGSDCKKWMKHIISVRCGPDPIKSVVKDINDVCLTRGNFRFIIFDADEGEGETEYESFDEGGQDLTATSNMWTLPSQSFDGLWESLIFSAEVKSRLLDYIFTTVLFSKKNVDPSLIGWNKLILLHGPPGTGKTSLCRALAQKSVIYLQDSYQYGQLVEINSHSLFSKWFSESGKLVLKMFDNIIEQIQQDSNALVFLLIDEIESLVQCRQSSGNGMEPADSIRVVNALLTQIDKMRKYPNVIVMATSNVVGKIDSAFVDRADLKLFIGSPPTEIIYSILASCLNELLKLEMVETPGGDPNYRFPQHIEGPTDDKINEYFCGQLFSIARKSSGLSGRTLRKLPFFAYPKFMRSPNNLTNFLACLEEAVAVTMAEEKAIMNEPVSPAILNIAENISR